MNMHTATNRRHGFTLIELLVTITIIGILTSLFLAALGMAADQAKEARTKAMIARLNTVIMTRWESYRTRRVPVNTSGMNPVLANIARRNALRELQRLEMPQCYEDITVDLSVWPAVTTANVSGTVPTPAISLAYLRRIQQNTKVVNGVPTAKRPTSSALDSSPTNDRAECLYLIVTMGGIDDEATPIDHFRSLDVGDTDNDGMFEFLDGWGNPISFLRWPTAFISDLQPDPTLPDPITFSRQHHDPFDPAMTDLPSGSGTPTGFRLTPLIYSFGSDGASGINGYFPFIVSGMIQARVGSDTKSSLSGSFSSATSADPYAWPSSGSDNPSGSRLSADVDLNGMPVQDAWLDNIHNHNLGSQTK